MNARKPVPYIVGLIFIIQSLACGSTPTEPTAAPTTAPTAEPTAMPAPASEAPAGQVTEAVPGAYVPVTPEVCQTIQELATQAVSLTFTMETNTPFTDMLTGETGQGCTLTATSTGAQLDNPFSVMRSLVDGMLGWEEQPGYQADGPTGTATGMTRDMALMLLLVEWTPAPEVQCPADQPISACNIKPEQHLYTVQIQTAMK